MADTKDVPMTHERTYCRDRSPDGNHICSLYADHYGPHRGNHLATRWGDVEDE